MLWYKRSATFISRAASPKTIPARKTIFSDAAALLKQNQKRLQ